jgi:hypothetical protein
MKRKNKSYRELARKIIEMSLGDKIVLPEEEKPAPENTSKEDTGIEMKFDSSKPVSLPKSMPQRIINGIIILIIIAAAIIGLIIPSINCIAFTIFTAKASFIAGYAQEEEQTIHEIYVTTLYPIIKYWGINALFSIFIAVLAIFTTLCLQMIKLFAYGIEKLYLQKEIKKNYDKIARKADALDKEEEARLKRAEMLAKDN